jgi:IS30 family transposase
MGAGGKGCVVTLVERKTGLVLIGKLTDGTAGSLRRMAVSLMRRRGGRFETVTADNGTEFHDYQRIEELTGAAFYFARPYHSRERGSNENANGLIRQWRRTPPERPSPSPRCSRRCSPAPRPSGT